MNITLAEFTVSTLTGIAAGWLWSSPDAHLLEPLRRPINRTLRRSGSVGRWLLAGSECPVCVGFWAQLVMFGAVTGWQAWTLPLSFAALVLHIGWQLITGLVSTLILR